MRIFVTVEQRRGGDVQAGPIRGDDEISIVLRCEALHGLDRFARIGLVVIFDDFDHALPAIDGKPAPSVHLIGPKRDIRPLRHGGAARERAGFRRDGADFHHIRRRTGEVRRRKTGDSPRAKGKGGSSVHLHASFLPRLSMSSIFSAVRFRCRDSHRISVNSSRAAEPPNRP